MESCDCIDTQYPPDELLVKYQYISDVLIALAYFSIPVELIYFVQKSAFFPYRWVLMQFGAFIVLCGATHFINLWTFSPHSKAVAVVMTIAKVSCAIVSCATALMLVHIIPDLLSVKTRELFLKNKAEELDREMGLILTQEETGRHVRMLTHEIRSTLDRHTILKTTLVELGRTLGLEECALWMPSRNGLNLQLSHTLTYHVQVGSTVQTNNPIVNEVFNSPRAMRIPPTCPLARIRPLVGRYVPPEVVAVRVPLLNLSNFQINDWPDISAKNYAIMVLILPTDSVRKWRDHELELVDVVADQVLNSFEISFITLVVISCCVVLAFDCMFPIPYSHYCVFLYSLFVCLESHIRCHWHLEVLFILLYGTCSGVWNIQENGKMVINHWSFGLALKNGDLRFSGFPQPLWNEKNSKCLVNSTIQVSKGGSMVEMM